MLSSVAPFNLASSLAISNLFCANLTSFAAMSVSDFRTCSNALRLSSNDALVSDNNSRAWANSLLLFARISFNINSSSPISCCIFTNLLASVAAEPNKLPTNSKPFAKPSTNIVANPETISTTGLRIAPNTAVIRCNAFMPSSVLVNADFNAKKIPTTAVRNKPIGFAINANIDLPNPISELDISPIGPGSSSNF